MLYPYPGASGAPVTFKSHYDNFIGGKFVPPVEGQYMDVITPITGKVFARAAQSTAQDIELALDAAHAAGRRRANHPLELPDFDGRLEAGPRHCRR